MKKPILYTFILAALLFTGCKKGDQGLQGEKGDTGATGVAGSKGDTGLTGANGQTGPQGPVGPPGANGAQGPKGESGDNGVMVYTFSQYIFSPPSLDRLRTITDSYNNVVQESFRDTVGISIPNYEMVLKNGVALLYLRNSKQDNGYWLQGQSVYIRINSEGDATVEKPYGTSQGYISFYPSLRSKNIEISTYISLENMQQQSNDDAFFTALFKKHPFDIKVVLIPGITLQAAKKSGVNLKNYSAVQHAFHLADQ